MLQPLCRWIGGWTGAFALNAFIATYFLIFGVGFGIWAALANLISNVHQYSVFAKCYQASCNAVPGLHPSDEGWPHASADTLAQLPGWARAQVSGARDVGLWLQARCGIAPSGFFDASTLTLQHHMRLLIVQAAWIAEVPVTFL